MTKILSMKMAPRKGTAVVLGEEEHRLASYLKVGEKIVLTDIKTVDSATLSAFSRKGSRMSLCFSPRGIYSDVGEFSCVSREATTAHIRSTVDKIGLFKDDYHISFTKIQDIDGLKSKYSYLAIASNDLNKTKLIDEKEALIDMFCPIEASIAASVGSHDSNMVIIVYEDTRFIRIIGAKAGIIYYLLTINSAESFDASADTVAGIREMTSMLLSSNQEKVQKIYIIGQGEISIPLLQENDIHAERFCLNETMDTDPLSVVLFGTALSSCYDFTPESLHKTARIVKYSKLSLAISLLMTLISIVLYAMGSNNAAIAKGYEKKAHSAIYKSSQELKLLQADYASLSKDLNLANINNIIEAYKDSQAEPRLHSVVYTISQRVPDHVFITKIELARSTSQKGSPQARLVQTDGNAARTAHAGSFTVSIQGIINSPYPLSKQVFSSFIDAMQEVFKVSDASYSHKEQTAEFSLNCEIKL